MRSESSRSPEAVVQRMGAHVGKEGEPFVWCMHKRQSVVK